MGLIILLAVLAAFVVVLWLIGANEPVYRIIKEATWFVAVRGGTDDVALSPNVSINWSARADFPFIGGGDPYWSLFYILAGGEPGRLPIDVTDAEDAYIARVAFGAPPKLALGVLRLFITLGILSKPASTVSHDVQAKGHRAELRRTRDFSRTREKFKVNKIRAKPDSLHSAGRFAV